MRKVISQILVAVLFLTAGCGSDPVTPSPPAAQPVAVYEPGNGVSLPTVVRDATPNYTAAAIGARIQGTVVLAVVVLSDGTIGDVTVLQSLDMTYGLDAEAVKAAKQWQFKPGTKDGNPVAVRVRIEMTFTLR
jgi:protein TonB